MTLDDIIRQHRQELDRLEAAARDAIVGPYVAAQASILAKLEDLARAGEDQSFTAEHLRIILAQLDDTLRTMEVAQQEPFMGEFNAVLQLGAGHTLAEVVHLEATFGDEVIAAQVSTVIPVIPAARVAAIADPAQLLLTQFRGQVFQEVAAELAQVIIRGEGIGSATRRLRGAIEGRDFELERIARTEINNAANLGHESTIGQVAESYPDLGLKKQWSTRLDGRESDICRALNGQIRAAGEAFTTAGMNGVPLWTGEHPPAHPNCRSRVVPWSQRWVDRGLIKGNVIDFHAYRARAYAHQGGCGGGCDHKEGHMLKRNGRDGERKALALSGFKMIDEAAGTFEGYAAAFGNVDSHGDIIQKGAFTKTIAGWQSSGKMVPILWQHDPDHPIGVCDPAGMAEDDHGLKVTGKLIVGVQKADEARLLMQSGALGGLSIGYDIPAGGQAAAPKGSGAKRLLKEIDLWEWSPVTWPSNTKAEYGEVKTAEGKSADFATVLRFDEWRAELWDRSWKIHSALREANDLAVADANLTREGKLAAVTGNLAQFSQAMIAWFGDWLTLAEQEAAAGLKASPMPAETKDGGPSESKVGKTISAATQAQIETACAAIESGAETLKNLIKAAPAADAGSVDTQPKGSGPAPSEQDGQASKAASVAAALERMRKADALHRMKAAL